MIDAGLLAEWQAFWQLEPWGFETEMYGHAMTAATIANVHRKSGSAPVQPHAFIPRTHKPLRVQNPREARAVLRSAIAMAASAGGG